MLVLIQHFLFSSFGNPRIAPKPYHHIYYNVDASLSIPLGVRPNL